MKSETINIIGEEVGLDTDYLNLSFFGQIEKVELQKLLRLKSIKHLNVSSSDLLDEHLEVIGHLETLELLDLDSTEITDTGLQYLKPLKQLREIRLKDNPQLTNGCVEVLSKIEGLALIHIANTSITIAGLIKLLSQKELESVILDFEFDNEIDELLIITEKYPKLEITLKGTGIISDGKLNE